MSEIGYRKEGFLLRNVRLDLEALNMKANLFNFFRALFQHPGFRTVLLYRISHWLYQYKGTRILAWFFFNLNHFLSGCELKPSARIGGGLFLPHAVGIVVGEGVVIGEGCTIYQNVTIGLARPEDPKYPYIGQGVRIYAGASVLGGVHIGDGAEIGAHAVVLQDVPSGALAVGIPACVKERTSV